jgi:hypothetical protein
MKPTKASQSNPLSPTLVELALDLVGGREITLKTDRGWFDHAELRLYWYAGSFECCLTVCEAGRTLTGPTWYDPPETERNETTHQASFRKIRQVDEWARQHHFKIETSQREA